ncbi:neuronal acetylcholine receptor subunit beta-3-like [Pomacea canaliculata]|uniref:neuronal acetylcholine receptor subunit beta-3-like n=1 Tax=Pomacea canaliculata TaxID=400727 RepID=UPI000D73CB19|nr:neuronal acetylcholine receptor subunit beta-3-like [Pomacea canaliculata]
MSVRGSSPQTAHVLITIMVFIAMATQSQGATKENYYNLTDYLFKGYKKEVRPVYFDFNSTFVFIAFSLFSIVDMNEQDQTIKTNALLTIEWLDQYLSWNTGDFGDIESILVKQNMLWLPDIVVDNTVTPQTELGYKNLQVRILNFGVMDWQPTGVFETSCDIDVTYYPFDTQVCSIVFTTAMSTSDELSIFIDKSNPVLLDNFSPDGIWDVVNTSAENKEAENKKASIVFSLQLKRRPTFYVLNIILPVVFLAMTSSLVFALPAESGEKMSLSITVLLAFRCLPVPRHDAMPKTSVQVSLLMVYVILLMALTAFSVVLSIFVLKLHHRPSDKPFGRKAIKIIIFLQKLMCSQDTVRPNSEDKKSSQDDDVISIIGEYVKQKNKANAVVPYDTSQKADDSRCGSASSCRRSSEVSGVNCRQAAETLSMFLFYMFVLFVVVSTIVCMVILVAGGARQEENTRFT